MKLLHLMTNEKFTRGICEFYDFYYNNGEHDILFINFDRNTTCIQSDLSIQQKEIFLSDSLDIKNCIEILKLISKYDYFVLHSLFIPYLLQLFICTSKKLIQKMVWIEWGYDLYLHQDYSKSFLRKTICSWVDRRIRTKIKAFVGIFPPDCDYYKEQYGDEISAKIFYAPYCGAKISEDFLHYSPNSILNCGLNDEPIYIQIGHNAIPTLNHIEVLHILERFKNENIKIFLPLSYGDIDYGDEVEKEAFKIFGKDKCICLRSFMPAKDYYQLQNKVGIAIFNTYRQCGLGNINRMIFKNIKIYMPRDSVMYNYFCNNGVPISSIEQLHFENFDQFIRPAETENQKQFTDYLENYSSMDRKVAYWNEVYSFLNL